MFRKLTIKLLALAVGCSLVFGLAVQASAAEYIWRCALEEIDGSMQDHFAEKFVELLEKKSDGKIHVDLYYYGQLGTSEQITELLQDGSVQFAFQSPGHLGSYIPEVQVFSIHYLFPPDKELLKKVLTKGKHTYNTLQKYYNKNELELLSVIEEGWQIWTANKPLRKPSDFEGIKFRVMASPMLIEAYRAYGANVSTLPYSEIYSALQLGMIDAQTQPFFAIEEMKFYEQQKYMIKAYQLPFIATFAANHEFYQGLPDDIKKIVQEAIKGANEYIFDFEDSLNQKRKKKIMKKKPDIEYIELTEEEIAAFKEKAKAVQDKYLEIGGKGAQEVLDAVKKDVEAVSN